MKDMDEEIHTMLLKEFLEKDQNQKRILVVRSVENAYALIRKYERESKQPVRNVVPMTLEQMAKECYLFLESFSDSDTSRRIMERKEALMFFRSVVFDELEHCSFFTNKKKLLSLATISEIYQKVNLIRECGWKENPSQGDNSRIWDLKHLASVFPAKLYEENVLDITELFQKVLDDKKKLEQEQSTFQLFFGAEIYYLEEDMGENMELLSGQKKCFLTMLQKIINTAGKCHSVRIWNTKPCVKDLQKPQNDQKYSMEFYRAFGGFPEAAFIAQDLRNHKYPEGSVQVFYASNKQIVPLQAAFQGNKIPACFLSSYSVQNNMLISLARRILDWAADDFSERGLEKILSSPAIMVPWGNNPKKNNALGWESYFSHVTNAASRREDKMILGWGYERNRKFLENEYDNLDRKEKEVNGIFESSLKDEQADEKRDSSIAKLEKSKAVLKFHDDLLDIFSLYYSDEPKNNPSQLFDRLFEFLFPPKKKQNPNDSDQQKVKYLQDKIEANKTGLPILREIKTALKWEKSKMSLEDSVGLIRELLQDISDRDDTDNNKVKIRKLNDWRVPECPILYVAGLSLKDMQGRKNESPVLTDQEMKKYLGEGYESFLFEKNAKRKEENLLRILYSFSGKRVVLVYSCYDTDRFIESNPSSICRELMEQNGQEEAKIPQVFWGNPSHGITKPSVKSPQDIQIKEDLIRHLSSSTLLEELLECPKKYAYKHLHNIPENDYYEYNPTSWLNALEKGSLFHEIAQTYVDEVIISSENPLPGVTDVNRIVEELVSEKKDRMMKEVPYPSFNLVEEELKNMKDLCEEYFTKLHSYLHKELPGWIPLVTEQKFVRSEYRPLDGYNFLIRGYIDRIDYLYDKENNTVYVRITDYKTGKKKDKEEARKLGKVLQHIIYQQAWENGYVEEPSEMKLKKYIQDKIAEQERIKPADIEKIGWRYDGFEYVFPEKMLLENVSKYRDCTISIKKKRGRQRENRDPGEIRLQVILSAIEDNKLYPDRKTLFDYIEEYKKDNDEELEWLKLSYTEEKYCQYCNYHDLCGRESR